MEMDIVKDKVERLKVKAEFLLKNNLRAFVKDNYGTYYFCDILIVGEERLLIKDFEGKRSGENTYLFWVDILDIQEYKSEVGDVNSKA
jgi:hypothetical protein